MRNSSGLEILKRHSGLSLADQKRLRSISFFATGLLVILLAALAIIGGLVKVDVTVPASGALEAAGWVEVKAPVDGIVQALEIVEGQKVTAGQPLLTLENAALENEYQAAKLAFDTTRARKTQLETEIESTEQQLNYQILTAQSRIASLDLENPGKVLVAQAKLEKARVRVAQAEADYRKAQDLFEQGVQSGVKRDEAKKAWELALADAEVSQKELDATRNAGEAELSKARAELAEKQAQGYGLDIKRKELASILIEMEKARGQIRHLEQQRERLKILAPADGEILTHRPDQSIGRHVNPGDVLLEIGDPELLMVKARIAEEYLPRIRAGLPAKIYLPALPYREYRVFDGMLAEIGATFDRMARGDESFRSNGSATAPIRIALQQTSVMHDGEVVRLKPGLTAQVEIVVRNVGIYQLVWEEIQRIRSRKPNLTS